MHWPSDPGGHGVSVRLAVVVVEDHDGRHHAARHHEHDAVEIGTCHLIHFNHLIYLLYVIKYIMLKHAVNKKKIHETNRLIKNVSYISIFFMKFTTKPLPYESTKQVIYVGI